MTKPCIYEKKPTKETYNRDLVNTSFSKGNSLQVSFHKRDLQKRPTKETYNRDLVNTSFSTEN